MAELNASHRIGSTPKVELVNMPLSDLNRTVALNKQPGAGDNTGSIEPGLFIDQTSQKATFMRSTTLDDELSSRGLGDAEVLILKIDVEGQ